MTITKNTITICKEAIEFFEANPDKNAYVKLKDDDQNYIVGMVVRGLWYYGERSYTFWDGSVYGFSFDANLFKSEKGDV